MDLIPTKRTNTPRPERQAPFWAWPLSLLAYVILMGIGGKLTEGANWQEVRTRLFMLHVPMAAALIVLAILTRRWQRRPRPLGKSEIVEADPKTTEWAARVLATKRKA